MKTKSIILVTTLLLLLQTTFTLAQDKRKYHIVLNIDKNGEPVNIDTTFGSREEMESFMQSHDMNIHMKPVAPHGFEYEFEIPDVDIPEQDLKKMKDDMKRIRIEMNDHKQDMEHEKKAVREERKKQKTENKSSFMWVEVEKEADGNGNEKVIIKKGPEGDKKIAGEPRVVIIETEDDGGNGVVKKEIKIFRDHENSPEKRVNVVKSPDQGTASPVPPAPVQPEEPVLSPDQPVIEKSFNKSESYQLDVTEFNLYPNPTRGQIEISFKTPYNEPVWVRILDSRGREIVNEQINLNDGVFNKSYNIEGNSRGTCLVQIKQGEKWRHEKVVLK